MGPSPKRIERPPIEQMKAAFAALDAIDDLSLNPLSVEEFANPECDQLRVHFWLGTDQSQSATYTFTLTSNMSLEENVGRLTEFVREQLAFAAEPPA